MKTLLIWGVGDQGIVTLDCALAMKEYSKIDFLAFKEKEPREISGYLIYKEEKESLNNILKAYDEVIVATGSNNLREDKISILNSMNINSATIIHPTAVISPLAKVSKGCTVLANAVINANALIGIGCIVNTSAVVEHDCIIEDFVNISPKASMAGHTKICRKSFLGIGCTIIDKIVVGKETIVGAGAVVVRNVPENTTVIGVPAKVIK